MRTHRVHLVRRPQGLPTPQDFEMVEADLPPLADGQILVENLWMSVEPYMRRCMDTDCTDQTPWPLHAPLNGPAIGRVVQSRNASFVVGDVVESLAGWQRHFISDGNALIPFVSTFCSVLKRNAPVASLSDYLTILGIASFTAYAAVILANDCKSGDTIVISSAAGTVGSLAAQLAMLRGMRVVGSAGSEQKVRWLRDVVGIDYAFNYRTNDFEKHLRQSCPNGIDLVLENVSPEQMTSCFPFMNSGGTVLVSGFVGLYSTGGKAKPADNLEFILNRFLTIKAFTYMDFYEYYERFVSDVLSWQSEGRLRMRETVFDELNAAPLALSKLMQGEVEGKPIVRIGAMTQTLPKCVNSLPRS
jgi:NADPH-dependent curcumin reductase CurA